MSSLLMLYSVVPLALFVQQAAAWGNLGHQTVGYVAQQVRTSLHHLLLLKLHGTVPSPEGLGFRPVFARLHLFGVSGPCCHRR